MQKMNYLFKKWMHVILSFQTIKLNASMGLLNASRFLLRINAKPNNASHFVFTTWITSQNGFVFNATTMAYVWKANVNARVTTTETNANTRVV